MKSLLSKCELRNAMTVSLQVVDGIPKPHSLGFLLSGLATMSHIPQLASSAPALLKHSYIYGLYRSFCQEGDFVFYQLERNALHYLDVFNYQFFIIQQQVLSKRMHTTIPWLISAVYIRYRRRAEQQNVLSNGPIQKRRMRRIINKAGRLPRVTAMMITPEISNKLLEQCISTSVHSTRHARAGLLENSYC